MYAVIAAGGRQYRVSQGDVIYVDKISKDPDTAVTFDVLMVGGEDEIKVGHPILEGAKVEGKIVSQVITPILADGEIIGGLMLLSRESGLQMTDIDHKVAETTANIIGRQMEQ